MSLTLVTDGTPEAAALARWLSTHQPLSILEGRSEKDAALIDAARSRVKEKRVVLSGGDEDKLGAAQALSTVKTWLAPLSPFEVRARGARLIEQKRRERATGSETLDSLLTRLSPVRIPQTTGRRGRPKGSDPFKGVGFEVCTLLLLHPDNRWTDRALAERTGRAPSAVHKMLSELDARGLVRKGRSGTVVDDPMLLRADLLAHWRDRVRKREGKGFRLREPEAYREVLRVEKEAHLLAASSATAGPWAFVGGPTLVYTTPRGLEVLQKKWDPVSASLATLIVWQAPEQGVFLAPREGRTNRVLTWLDLITLGGAREKEAAEAVWRGEG